MPSEQRIDIVYLACGRPAFTQASMYALLKNTNLGLVRRLIIFTDADTHALPITGDQVETMIIDAHFGGPVAIMNAYLDHGQPSDIWAKIDNDVIVPPGWLDAALGVMRDNSELDLLGIEPPASRTPRPGQPAVPSPEIFADFSKPGYAKTDCVGGVGVFRTRAWQNRPPMRPHSIYGGFTDWQQENKDLVIGWIVPTLKLFLLDRIHTVEPWKALNREYYRRKLQRPWTPYDVKTVEYLAGWWLNESSDAK